MSRLIDALQVEPRQLIALWRDVFGDPPELPAAFLRQLPAIDRPMLPAPQYRSSTLSLPVRPAYCCARL